MSTADVLWDWLGPGFTDNDPDGVLRDLVEAYADPIQLSEDIIRASAGRPGWAAALDPDTAPERLLPWLAQFAGVELDERLTVQQWRDAIKARPNTVRGTLAALRSSANDWMASDEYQVIVRERYQDNAWRVAVDYIASTIVSPQWDALDPAATWTDMSPSPRWIDIIDDEDALRAAIVAAVPAEIVPTVQRLDGATYQDLADDFATVADQEAYFDGDPGGATVRDVRYYIPQAAYAEEA